MDGPFLCGVRGVLLLDHEALGDHGVVHGDVHHVYTVGDAVEGNHFVTLSPATVISMLRTMAPMPLMMSTVILPSTPVRFTFMNSPLLGFG